MRNPHICEEVHMEELFRRVAGPLKKITPRLAVGRCPSCGEEDALFIDLKTGNWRCGRLPDGLTDSGPSLREEA